MTNIDYAKYTEPRKRTLVAKLTDLRLRLVNF